MRYCHGQPKSRNGSSPFITSDIYWTEKILVSEREKKVHIPLCLTHTLSLFLFFFLSSSTKFAKSYISCLSLIVAFTVRPSLLHSCHLFDNKCLFFLLLLLWTRPGLWDLVLNPLSLPSCSCSIFEQFQIFYLFLTLSHFISFQFNLTTFSLSNMFLVIFFWH